MPSPKSLPLSDRGITRTTLILPAGAGDILREAASDLQATLEKMTGAAPTMGPDDGRRSPPGRTFIHLGRTACARHLHLDAGDLGVEAYRLATSGRDLFILGGSDCATSYGVYGLLEDHLHCRWFMPGDLFEDIPVRTTLRIPPINETTPPHFQHRVFSGIFSLEGSAWERRNRVSRRRPELPYAGFHHALYRIFPVAESKAMK